MALRILILVAHVGAVLCACGSPPNNSRFDAATALNSGGRMSDAGDAGDGAGGSMVSDSGGGGAVVHQDASQMDAEVDAGTMTPIDGGLPLEVCQSGDVYGDPLPADRTATLVRDGFNFLEGPVWLTSLGALYFSDMDMGNVGANGVASRIHQFEPPSAFTTLVPSSGSNGLAVDSMGLLYACTHDTQSLSTFDPLSGARADLSLTYMGSKFNSPNDLAIRADGNIYFSDPDWQLPPRASQIGMTGVYQVDLANNVKLVDGTLDKPNGIALSPDGNTLYVGSAGNDIFKYSISSNGDTSGKMLFASPGASDGFAVDCAGNLYVSSGMQVLVYSSASTLLGQIDVPEAPANAAFGGEDRKTLYITARTGLYQIRLNVPGFPY